MGFFVTWYKKRVDQREIKKISFSVQRSVAEQFSFNEKKFSQCISREKSASVQEMFTRKLDTRRKTLKKLFKI